MDELHRSRTIIGLLEVKDAEIARLTAALAEADARSAALVAGAYEAAAKECADQFAAHITAAIYGEPANSRAREASANMAERLLHRIRALAQKEAGAVFPPPRCTAWEDCKHDGICHDFKYCEAIGPSHEAFYGEAEE